MSVAIPPRVEETVEPLEARPLFDPPIVKQAIKDSFVKLNPRTLVRNPVIFVVEVVSLVVTIRLIVDALEGGPIAFDTAIAVGLWFTVLFANFAEAMAEGRGKAQAESLRRTRADLVARRLGDDGKEETVPASDLRAGDLVMVSAGELIPGDGEIVEGIASVDESAITGESAPVIRESGGDRSAVTGGTKVLSDWIKVRITAEPGEGFIDRMIRLVEGAERQKTPNEIALSLLLVKFTIIFLIVCVALQPFAIYAGGRVSDAVLIALFVCLIPTTIGGLLSAIGIAGHGPARAAQRAGDERAGGGGGRRRLHAPARQDRDDHAGQPAGRPVRARHPASTSAISPRSPRWRRSPTRRPRAVRSSSSPRSGIGVREHELLESHAALRSLHGADADERRRPRGRPRSARARSTRSRPGRAASSRPSSPTRSSGSRRPAAPRSRSRRTGYRWASSSSRTSSSRG